MGKIFVRERRKAEKGEKKARFRVIGVTGNEVKIYANHVRKTELDILAKETGVQVVYLPRHGSGDQSGQADD